MVKAITEQVNLLEYPQSPHILKPGEELTIGDLHGNSLKFMFFLIKEGILTLKNREKDYEEIKRIYEKNDLTKADLEQFQDILSEAEFNEAASKTKIKLIGDEVADRGKNDYFTLLILDKLREKKVPIEIIFSNHGAEFVSFYEIGNCTGDFPTHINTMQARSLNLGLLGLIDKGLVSTEDIQKLIDDSYKPNLKLLSYSIDQTTKPNTIILYSHAPIGLETVEGLAIEFGVTYDQSSLENLAKTINAINSKFAELVANNRVIERLEEEKIEEEVVVNAPIAAGITRAIWNRVNYQDSCSRVKIKRPSMLKSDDQEFIINYVHGHDGVGSVADEEQDFVTNLDNNLGKGGNYNSGEYVVEKRTPPPQLLDREKDTTKRIPTFRILSSTSLAAADLKEAPIPTVKKSPRSTTSPKKPTSDPEKSPHSVIDKTIEDTTFSQIIDSDGKVNPQGLQNYLVEKLTTRSENEEIISDVKVKSIVPTENNDQSTWEAISCTKEDDNQRTIMRGNDTTVQFLSSGSDLIAHSVMILQGMSIPIPEPGDQTLIVEPTGFNQKDLIAIIQTADRINRTDQKEKIYIKFDMDSIKAEYKDLIKFIEVYNKNVDLLINDKSAVNKLQKLPMLSISNPNLLRKEVKPPQHH